MIFNELIINTNSLGYELISGVLLGAGVTCFAVEDRNDLDEILNNKSIPIDYVEDNLLADSSGLVKVKIYLADNEQGRLTLDEIEAGINSLKKECEFDLGSLEVIKNKVDDNDWADNWKAFFHPTPIGEKIIVKPSWEVCEASDRIVLEIDPESSFGTGQHETTALCLELLEKVDNKDMNVLDMGCGSGILGIGSVLLGAKSVLCVDIDKNATDIAAKNAMVNKLKDGKLSVLCGNILEDKTAYDRVCVEKYDIILANIVADIIKGMVPIFKKILNENGTLICSGIIAPKKKAVISSLTENGFFISDILEKNDWVAVKCIPNPISVN
ncbi:MAG: ribosomal protein L11 methyltransferase [Clostridiales bacterium GWF2_36_10]|nr:MAG: ribosomal protein L11 methyltransferase [Clostridiales bacterium GWF2_36_10]